VKFQRWIVGRRLADDDQLTLKDYDISPHPSMLPLFLYVLNNSSNPTPAPNPSFFSLSAFTYRLTWAFSAS
jgi:hypothetical protein